LSNIRTRASGVGTRLLIVIFGIGAVAALVAGAAIYAFVEVGHSLALIDRRIDPILASVEVSRTVERIVTAASALSAATTEQRRDHLFAKLSHQSTKLRSFLNELRDGGISQEQLAPIEGKAVQLDANLTALDADVRLRLQLIGRIKDLMQGVFDTNDETRRLLGPTLLVYDSQLDHLAKLLTGVGQPSDPLAEDVRPLIAGLLAARPVQKVQQQASDAADALAQAAVSEQKQRLLILAFQLRRAISELEKGAQSLDPKLQPLFLAQVEKFKTLVDGPSSIPQLRRRELDLIADAGRLLAENDTLSTDLTDAAQQLVAATKREVRGATESALHTQRLSTTAISVLLGLGLVGSVLIVWLYVGRNIVRRLNLMSGAMFAIAGGGRETTVPVTGNDEIAAMGRAVEVFRQNAIERDALLAERAAAAERLEQQVKERTAELTEALDQQTATTEVLQVINSSPGNLAPVFDAMLEKAMRLCEASYGELRTYDGHTFHVGAMRGVPATYAKFMAETPVDFGPETGPGRVLRGEPFIHIIDLINTDNYRNGEPSRRAVVDLGGARTLLLVPLRKDEAVLGFIMIYRTEVRPFTSKQIALLQNFADQAVIAMENARLLDEIRQAQAELRVTFDNMADGVAMFDEQLRLAAWNRNFQQILDLSETLLAARPSYREFFRYLARRGEYGSADLEAELSRAVEDTERELRLERTRPDGRVVEVRRNPVPGGGFVLIYSDVTERKRSEAEIRAARDTAEAAYRDLKTAQASLVQAEKMASLGQLTAGIAHEIKNPLNFVNNFADLSVELLDELKETTAPVLSALDADKRAEIDEVVGMLTGNLEKIAEHGRRADGIVKSMLEHSRGASGERREVDLNGLVEEALNLAYHGARAQDANFNISLERDFDPAIAPIDLAPQEITRVLLNLFGNGFYAADKRRREAGDGFRPALKVTTSDLGGEVEIRVRDNGTGIPPEIRDKLFQPFFTTKPTGEGTGLGLSISWDIVTQQHGGTITVDSRAGEFTEFTIRLPRIRQAIAAAAAAEAAG
jgi:PAS domain S-box-containing protein